MNLERLKKLALAREYAMCHGYGVSEEEIQDMKKEVDGRFANLDATGIGKYEGASESEIVNELISEILTPEGT